MCGLSNVLWQASLGLSTFSGWSIWNWVMSTFKGKLHSKIISHGLIIFFFRIQWWRSEVKIRTGRQSSRGQKSGACECLRRQWCHLAIVQGHSKRFEMFMISRKPVRTRPTVVNLLPPSRIQDCSAVSNFWCRAPVLQYRSRRHYPRFFWPFPSNCLTVFLFEFWPRTFAIKLYENRPARSETMILECSFPLKTLPTVRGS